MTLKWANFFSICINTDCLDCQVFLLHSKTDISDFLHYNLPRVRIVKGIKIKVREPTAPNLKTQYSANIRILL